MKAELPPYVILGCGYVGTRLAQSLLADGVRVRVGARRVALLEPLREQGAEVVYFDAGRPHQFGPALLGLDRPVVVYSIPGVPDLPQGEAVRRAATAALRMHARAFIYLGSSAVYGRSEEHLTSEWVDEDTAVASNDPDAALRLADEAAVQAVAQAGLRVVVLRLSAIYGPALSPSQPARGVRQRLRSNQYKLWDGGRYYFSRILIDDLVQIIRASADRAPVGSLYVVGDDHPCPQGEYGRWLARHLGLPEPPQADSHQSRSAGHSIRGRRLRNERIKRELGITLRYPSYKEGELFIDACEKGAPLPSLRITTAEPNEKAAAESSGAASTDAAAAPLSSAAAQPAALQTDSAAAPLADAGTLPSAAALKDSPAPTEPIAAAPAPAWPRLVLGEDLGVSAGQPPIGAQVHSLLPGQHADAGPLYLVLKGQLRAVLGERTAQLGPQELAPLGASLHNDTAEPALILSLIPGRLPAT